MNLEGDALLAKRRREDGRVNLYNNNCIIPHGCPSTECVLESLSSSDVEEN